MNAKETAGSMLPVDMRIGIINTIAKSIYADPAVKIREAVANSMDNQASWFFLYIDIPSRSVSLFDNGSGITRGRFNEIFANIGFGLTKDKFSNSYFGLGLMSILELGKRCTIITKSTCENQVLKLEVDSLEIFSEKARGEPIGKIKELIKLYDSDLEERERISIISEEEIDKNFGGFPDSFTEIILNDIPSEAFDAIAADDFTVSLRKTLPLKEDPDETFYKNIKNKKTVEEIRKILANKDLCPTIDVYVGASEGGKELGQIWKYYPDFRKHLQFEATDVVCRVKSYKDSKGEIREFAFYYITSIEDLEESTKRNVETGLWIRNKNFLVKEADYLQRPGSKQVTLSEPLKNWLYGEVFHKGMTDFLVVTRNEYNWESADFNIFREQILSELTSLNVELRNAWRNNKRISDLVIGPFMEMKKPDNPIQKCSKTLQDVGLMKVNEADRVLEELRKVRRPELEHEERSLERLIAMRDDEILLADDEQIKVVIDPKLADGTDFERHREQKTSRIVARLSPKLFSSRTMKFLERTFQVHFVAGKDSGGAVSIDVDNRKIYINPFNQDISRYSLSFIDVYIAVELAYSLSKSPEDMRRIMLSLLGNKIWKGSDSPRKYLQALNDELQRRAASLM
ncbi:hypothetical protein ACFLXO_04910 [Chloroflexota bacterium]